MGNAADPNCVLRIYLAEDSVLISERIVRMIHAMPAMRVVGTAVAAGEAIQGVNTCAPDVVILDVRLANSSGLTVLRHLKVTSPQLKVMMLTNFASDQYRQLTHQLGADAFLDKSNDFLRIPEILNTWRLACFKAPTKNAGY
jgi:DNA-binding NarL/FixJ family response regulator